MRVMVRESAADAAHVAAELVEQHLRDAIASRGRACLAVSGGRTPGVLFGDLAAAELDWSLVDLLQVDERVVPADSADRNWSTMGALRRVVPERQQHPMPIEAPDGDRIYAQALTGVAGNPSVLDVVHLGLGADGHTASLPPGDPVLGVSDVDVSWSGPYRGHRRLTLTLPVLRRAHRQVWLVCGVDKATALQALAAGTGDGPAVMAANAHAVICADQAAAALLEVDEADRIDSA
jgi:6-phosphogluconolactonase